MNIDKLLDDYKQMRDVISIRKEELQKEQAALELWQYYIEHKIYILEEVKDKFLLEELGIYTEEGVIT